MVSEVKSGVLPPPVKMRMWHLFRFATCLDKVVMGFGILFAVMMGCAMPGFAIIFGGSIDATVLKTSNQSSVQMMMPMLKWLGLIAGGMLLCGCCQQTFLNWAAERQCARMRMAYFKAILSRDISWFDVEDPASLPSRMAMEVQNIFDGIGPNMGLMAQCLGQFVAGVIVAFCYDWELSLVISGTIPIFCFCGYFMASNMARYNKNTQSWYSKANAIAEESLMAIRTVAAFGGENHEMRRYEERLNGARQGGIQMGVSMGLVFGIMMGVMSAMYGLAFWYASHYQVFSGRREASGVLLVFFSIFIGVSSLQNLGTPMLAMSKAVGSAESMFKVITGQSAIETDASQQDVPMPVIDCIEFRNVVFNYPSRPDVQILQGLTLEIRKGQKAALVGESGSGKSTVIQLLERFYDPLEGDVLVNGLSLRSLPVNVWRRKIGFVGQEPVLFATSILNNIKGGDQSISQQEAVAAAKEAQAFDFVDALPKKFETYVGGGGSQVSGGQKQRIAIARALVKRPQLLLLDEATSALDTASELLVQETLDKLQSSGEQSLTTISIAHRLSTIRNSDIIFVLKQGKLVEQGSHDELMKKTGEYHVLVQSQGGDDQIAKPKEVAATDEHNVDSLKESDSAEKSKSKSKLSGNNARKSEKEMQKERFEELKAQKFKTPHGRLFSLARPQWPMFPLAMMFAAAAGGCMPINGFFLANSLSGMAQPDKNEMLRQMTLWYSLFFVVGLVAFVGELGKWGIFTYIQEHLTQRLRQMAFKSIIRQNIGFFDDPRNSASALTATLATQTGLVATSVGVSLGNTLGSCLGMLTGVGIAFIGSWRLSLAILAMAPLIVVAMSILMKLMLATTGGQNDAYTGAYETATEAIINIRTVRALAGESYSGRLFDDAVLQVSQKEAKESPKKGLAFGVGNALMFCVYMLAFGYGSQLIDWGLIRPDKMYQSLFCILFGVMSAGMAAGFMPDAAKGLIAAADTFRIIDRETQIDAVNPAGTQKNLGDGTIAFQDVRFFYPHRPELQVLQAISFKVLQGQSVAFVGPSGCGKSTIFQLLQRFYDASEGAILIGGVDLKSFDVAFWRSQIGFVGQEPVLFDMSLEENVKYGKQEATHEEVLAAAKLANMEYVLGDASKIAWDDFVGSRGGKLSGGQKQRCAIARAMLRDPPILILDEATSALDSASEGLVQDALEKASQGRTTFSIAHRLSTIRNSDVIHVLKQGCIAEQGSHADLMTLQGLYWKMINQGLGHTSGSI